MITDIAAASVLAPLTGDFGINGAAELTLIGAASGAVGVWIVFFARAFLAESAGHALLPGLVIASALGGSLLVGALLGIGLAFVVRESLERAPRTSTASATSITVTAMVALGALIASRTTGGVGFESLLFGDPLAASELDVVQAAVVAVAIIAALVVFHERFAALAFDRDSAASLGLAVARTNTLMLAVFVLAIATSATAAGSLLALALLLGPAVAATAVGKVIGMRLAGTIVTAGGLGLCVGVLGLYLSYYTDWPASPSAALVACAIALSGWALSRVLAATRSTGSGAGRAELA